MSTKRKRLSIERKLELISRLEKGETVEKVSREFGIGRTTVTDIHKSKGKIKTFVSGATCLHYCKQQKTLRGAQNKELDEAVFTWFVRARGHGHSISRAILCEKAKSINQLLNGDSEFKASTGWLSRFRKRHGVHSSIPSGQLVTTEDVVRDLKELISACQLSSDQLYTCDETGLVSKYIPNRSLETFTRKSDAKFKPVKDCATLMLCANVSGSHLLPPLLVGRTLRPRCLNNVNVTALPVVYRAQRQARIDEALFKDWFDSHFVPDVTGKLLEQGLPPRAVLLLDNEPALSVVETLVTGEIRCVYVPKSATSWFQNTGSDVIEETKSSYQRRMTEFLLRPSPGDFTKKVQNISVRDIIYLVAGAWESVGESMLTNDLRNLNAGHSQANEDSAPSTGNESTEEIKGYVGESVEELIVCGNTGPSNHPLKDEEIEFDITNVSDQNLDEDESVAVSTVSHCEAVECFRRGLDWLKQQPEADPTQILLVRSLIAMAAKKA